LGQTRPTEEKIADVGPVPLSGAPIIKEHIWLFIITPLNMIIEY
jgi:hypothetical protein